MVAMKNLLFLLLLLAGTTTIAQNGHPPSSGGRGAAMGGTRVAFQDIYSSFGNQAGLAHLEGVSFGVLGEQKFQQAEFGTVAAMVAIPTKSGTFGINTLYYGFEGFNQQRLGLAYARKLFEKLSIGAQFDLLNTRIPDYGSNLVVTFEAGLQIEVAEGFHLGAHTYSPAVVQISEDDYLPTLLSIGLSYAPSDQFRVNAEFEKDIQFPMRFRSGVEYQIIDILWLRAGFASNPSEATFGFGVYFKNLRIDMASQYNFTLGLTPAIGIAYTVE